MPIPRNPLYLIKRQILISREERKADKIKHIEELEACEERFLREEISRLVSACMEKDECQKTHEEFLKQLLRQQLDEVVQEKELEKHSDSHSAVVEKASVAIGTSDCPDMDLARQHAIMLQIFGKNCMDYNLREQDLQRKLDEKKALFNNLAIEFHSQNDVQETDFPDPNTCDLAPSPNSFAEKVNRKTAGIFTLLNNDNNDNVPFDLQANNDDNTNDDDDDVFSVKSSKQTIEITSPVQISSHPLAKHTRKKRIRAIRRVPEDDRRTEVYEISCISHNSDKLLYINLHP
ncbi:5463_t:CDS:2 [Paraglomus brasilianum]|uniref:5463_t:CDS:1 n=1 Tax=Paraglomus brasilianum TaxID=144538 RepID=A0A9N8YSZ1_9GLOM|nr:5463_t:CDS:2 [Paraglomus brasilianum]